MKQKRAIVCLIVAIVDGESNISSACRSVHVKHGLFYLWKKVVKGESDSHLKKACDSLVPPATVAGIVMAPAAITT